MLIIWWWCSAVLWSSWRCCSERACSNWQCWSDIECSSLWWWPLIVSSTWLCWVTVDCANAAKVDRIRSLCSVADHSCSSTIADAGRLCLFWVIAEINDGDQWGSLTFECAATMRIEVNALCCSTMKRWNCQKDDEDGFSTVAGCSWSQDLRGIPSAPVDPASLGGGASRTLGVVLDRKALSCGIWIAFDVLNNLALCLVGL